MFESVRIPSIRRRSWVVVGCIAGALGAAAPTAAAEVTGCRASTLRIGPPVSSPFEPVVANPAGSPCDYGDRTALVASGRSGNIRVLSDGLNARTDLAPLHQPGKTERPENADEYTTHVAWSDVDTVTITVGPNRIVARGLRASLLCRHSPFAGGFFYVEPRADVADLEVNGQRIEGSLGGPDVPIPGVGTLHVSWIGATHDGSNAWTGLARALWLESSPDVVVAEARLEWSGDSWSGGNCG